MYVCTYALYNAILLYPCMHVMKNAVCIGGGRVRIFTTDREWCYQRIANNGLCNCTSSDDYRTRTWPKSRQQKDISFQSRQYGLRSGNTRCMEPSLVFQEVDAASS